MGCLHVWIQGLAAAMASWSVCARQRARLRSIATRIVHRGMDAALVSWRHYVRRMAGARALLWRIVATQKQLCWDMWWHYSTQVHTITIAAFRIQPQGASGMNREKTGSRQPMFGAARGCLTCPRVS